MQDIYRLIMGEDAHEWRERPPRGLDWTALMQMADGLLPECGAPDITTAEGFALARMKTLSKKPDIGCPDEESVHRALWLALGAAAFPENAQRTRARLGRAARAALALTHSAPPAGREVLRRRCGGPARAIAKLISFSINNAQQGGN